MARSVTVKTKKATRDLLAQFAGNQRVVKLFEDLAVDMTESIPTGMDALLDAIVDAQATADSARALGALVQAIASEALGLARQQAEVPVQPFIAVEAWPVGAVFISLNGNNPADSIGYGTWVTVASGRVLVGVNSLDPDFFPVGATGGAKTLSIADHTPHTHTFTDQVTTTPAVVQSGAGATVVGSGTNGSGTTSQENHALSHVQTGTGVAALPVMNPYLACYIWERTA